MKDEKAEKMVEGYHKKGIKARVKYHRAPSLMREFKKAKHEALEKKKK